MKLITKAIEKLIEKYPLYSQESEKDPVVIAKFFFGGWTWLVTEGRKEENGDILFFGKTISPYEEELGYFTLSQLQGIKKWGFPVVERDMYFKPCRLSQVA